MHLGMFLFYIFSNAVSSSFLSPKKTIAQRACSDRLDSCTSLGGSGSRHRLARGHLWEPHPGSIAWVRPEFPEACRITNGTSYSLISSTQSQYIYLKALVRLSRHPHHCHYFCCRNYLIQSWPSTNVTAKQQDTLCKECRLPKPKALNPTPQNARPKAETDQPRAHRTFNPQTLHPSMPSALSSQTS